MVLNVLTNTVHNHLANLTCPFQDITSSNLYLDSTALNPLPEVRICEEDSLFKVSHVL